MVAVAFVPKTFLPPQDYGEFEVGIELPPGTNLAAMSDMRPLLGLSRRDANFFNPLVDRLNISSLLPIRSWQHPREA